MMSIGYQNLGCQETLLTDLVIDMTAAKIFGHFGQTITKLFSLHENFTFTTDHCHFIINKIKKRLGAASKMKTKWQNNTHEPD